MLGHKFLRQINTQPIKRLNLSYVIYQTEKGSEILDYGLINDDEKSKDNIPRLELEPHIQVQQLLFD